MRPSLTLAAVLLMAGSWPASAELDRFVADLYPSTETEIIPGSAPEKRAEQVRQLHTQLKMHENAAAAERALVVEVTAQEAAAIGAPNPFEQRYQVGFAKPVGATVDLGAAVEGREKLAFGAWHENDGGVVWSGVVRSPGASALRLHLTGFALPRGVELYVYSEDGQAFGPYIKRGPTGDGELYTNTIFGDELRLQLRVRTAGKLGGAEGARFTIADLGWLGERFLAGRLHAGSTKTFCSFNAGCVENANCPSANTPSSVSATRSAIAHLLFPSGGGYYICSGGMVADSDTSTVIPYLITANHCISRSSEASGLETYFDYETPCNGSCATPYGSGSPRDYTTLGATIAKTSSTSDYTLLRLAQTPGGTRTYLGWSAAPLINTGTVLHRLSHPQGAPLAYSQHQEYSPSGTCRSWPRGNWIYEDTLIGATEGGSSGSPVLAEISGSAKLVGQLSGACGTNLSDKCDTRSNSTVDGAFAAYYPSVASFLGSGSGGSCLARGAVCTAGSQCCSGSCKGGKTKTCG